MQSQESGQAKQQGIMGLLVPCKGNFYITSAHYPATDRAAILNKCMQHNYMKSFRTVCNSLGPGVIIQEFASSDCSGDVKSKRGIPANTCSVQGASTYILEAPSCSTSANSTSEGLNTSGASRGYVLVGLISFFCQAVL